MRPATRLSLLALALLTLAACGDGGGAGVDAGPDAGAVGPLRINEVVADNEGVLVDEQGQTDDWFEVYNAGGVALELSQFTAAVAGGAPQRLPAMMLAPQQAVVLWADGSPAQGPRHLSFKLPAKGGQLVIQGPGGTLSDAVFFPGLDANEAFARVPDGAGAFLRCRYATPGRSNGMRCGPPPPPGLPPDVTFRPYAWPEPSLPQPLVITEVGLFPARFVELVNTSAAPVPLSDLQLRLAPHGPGLPWPGAEAGLDLPWPRTDPVAPGERLMVPLDPALDPMAGAESEGVLSLFRAGEAQPLDRVDFSRWPAGATLARFPESAGRPGATFALCGTATPGQANERCDPLPSRDTGDRLRHLLTARDFAALAEGGTEVDSQSVKFIVDVAAGGVVHFLSSRRWALHYTFVRERIEHQPALDRCEPGEAGLFEAGWREFSDREYFRNDDRRFLMGTLVKYGGSGARTVEFARGDVIRGDQMRQAFFAVVAKLEAPRSWSVRPQAADQVESVRPVDGTLPLLDPNAPFRGLTYQPLTPGIGYGVLRFVPASELPTAALGEDVIVITDDVPNDIPLVGGVITEAFQTPLSHVSILSRNRGIPDMALLGARSDPRLAPFLEKLVRLEVSGGGFTVAEASPAEAQAFRDKRRPQGPPVSPRLDTSVRGVIDLKGRGLEDLPLVGAKAAQLAELAKLVSMVPGCEGPLPVPPDSFAVAIVHSIEHFQNSGAAAVLRRWRDHPAFAVDPRVRAEGLAEVRRAILLYPVALDLLATIEQAAKARFGSHRFRLRSSSNTEDLPTFSGAGLYTSVSAAIGDPDRTVADGLRIVWASLWNLRAFDERALALIDSSQAAMAVLVHEAYHDVERANGVAVSRDVLDPTRSDVSYINAQIGEAAVTNPAPGVTSDELLYTSWQTPPITYRSRSSLGDAPALRPEEIARVSCFLRSAHGHFRERLDPTFENRWFAIEFEFKLVGPERRLVIKQGRPYGFGATVLPSDCRDL